MANVQKDHGYTQVAHELLEALSRANLSGQEFRFVMHLIRNTYGYNRKDYSASLANIGQAIDMNRISVKKTTDKLLAHRVIAVSPQGNRKPVKYRINKDYDTWLLPHRLTATVTPQANKSVSPQGNSEKVIPIIVKDNKKKKYIKKKASQIPPDFILTDKMKSYAETKGIDSHRVESVFEHFTNHHTAKGSLFKDWIAAWRTWCINDAKFNSSSQAGLSDAERDAIIEREFKQP